MEIVDPDSLDLDHDHDYGCDRDYDYDYDHDHGHHHCHYEAHLNELIVANFVRQLSKPMFLGVGCQV